MWRALRRDIRVVFERDPAAKSVWEVLLCYPGLHAIWVHRVTHRLYRWGWYLPARILSQWARFLTGVEIHPGAVLGEGLFIDHGMGVVIGETTEVGRDVTLYQGVTLGGTGKEKGKRHPTVEDGVVIAAGAKVLGNIVVGAHSRIGAGAVVVKPVPPDCTVVGVPGRIVRRGGQKVGTDLEHGDLPDPVAERLNALRREMEELERRLGKLENERKELEDADRSA